MEIGISRILKRKVSFSVTFSRLVTKFLKAKAARELLFCDSDFF